MARRCVFCQNVADSKEDAYPQWLRELMPPEGAQHRLERADELRTWHADTIEVKVKQVCRRCNNEWMSDMERATKPLLVPLLKAERTYGLTPTEQKRIGTWAYKTAIMLALATPSDQRFVPPQDYRFFYEHRRPPDGTHVWIAALYDPTGMRLGRSNPERLDYTRLDGTPEDRHGYRLSVSVLALVFQVVRDAFGEKFSRPRPFNEVWTRIIPMSKGTWPPRYAISVDSLDSLGEGRIIDV